MPGIVSSIRMAIYHRISDGHTTLANELYAVFHYSRYATLLPVFAHKDLQRNSEHICMLSRRYRDLSLKLEILSERRVRLVLASKMRQDLLIYCRGYINLCQRHMLRQVRQCGHILYLPKEFWTGSEISVKCMQELFKI